MAASCYIVVMPKSTKDESETKTEVRTVRLKPHVLERLEQMAKRDDRSVSYLLGKAVEEFVERSKK